MPAPKAPFLRFLESCGRDNPVNGCWIWRGQTSRGGYGLIRVFGRKMGGAHRLSYELHKGPITDGLHVLHSCDNKPCVNPDHLRLGTHAENMAEAWERGLVRQGTPNPVRGTDRKESIQVMVLGKPYPSIKQAELALGVASGSVRYWINRRPDKARIITKEEYLSHAQ